MGLSDVDLDTISLRCREEMERFRRNKPDDERFCFELFRRAIVKRSAAAWNQICTQYWSLVNKWVQNEMRGWQTACEKDHQVLTNGVFFRFWQYYTADKLLQSTSLANILSYLRTCVVSEIGQWKRQEKRRRLEVQREPIELDIFAVGPTAEQIFLRRVEARRIWEIILDQCQDEHDLCIAWSSFVCDSSPQQIQGAHPGLFPDVKDVYRRKRNLRERLLRDKRLIDQS